MNDGFKMLAIACVVFFTLGALATIFTPKDVAIAIVTVLTILGIVVGVMIGFAIIAIGDMEAQTGARERKHEVDAMIENDKKTLGGWYELFLMKTVSDWFVLQEFGFPEMAKKIFAKEMFYTDRYSTQQHYYACTYCCHATPNTNGVFKHFVKHHWSVIA